MLFYKRSARWKHFKGHWTGPNECRMCNELRRKDRNSIYNRFLLKTYFHCLLSFTFVTLLIYWPLSPADFSVFWCQSCFVCSGLTYEIYSGYICLYACILRGLLEVLPCKYCTTLSIQVFCGNWMHYTHYSSAMKYRLGFKSTPSVNCIRD